MTETLTFTTPGGTAIALNIITERELDIDHTYTRPCFDLEVRANGKRIGPKAEVVDRPHGRCLLVGNTAILIPAQDVARVEAFVSAYKAAVSRRVKAELDAEAKSYRVKSASELANDRIDAEDAEINSRRRR